MDDDKLNDAINHGYGGKPAEEMRAFTAKIIRKYKEAAIESAEELCAGIDADKLTRPFLVVCYLTKKRDEALLTDPDAPEFARRYQLAKANHRKAA